MLGAFGTFLAAKCRKVPIVKNGMPSATKKKPKLATYWAALFSRVPGWAMEVISIAATNSGTGRSASQNRNREFRGGLANAANGL